MNRIGLACIIDDDPIFVFGAQRMMNSVDFCDGFLIFHNGKVALDYLLPINTGNSKEEVLPDIILLDINMPVMDGWQFLDELVKFQINKTIRIYIVSSSIDPKDLDKAKSYKSVKNFIVKPVSRAKLKSIMMEYSM